MSTRPAGASIPWRALAGLAWRDLRASGRHLWVFWACLMLGVTLIAATGGLFRQVSDGLLADTRVLFGGDVEVESRTPLDADTLRWIGERGEVSLLVELRTMLFAGDSPHLVELQSVDARYPLYGRVALQPDISIARAVEARDGVWGAAIDPLLARRLELTIGDQVEIGMLSVEVRALIERQPDRGLRADWRGPPVLVAADMLGPSGLIGPGSRLEHKYRVKTDGDAAAWAQALARAFPAAQFEVRTFAGRRGRIAEVLGQVASGLLIIGFSALFVGGLGVFNSVRAYLDAKLATIATLRALGLRDGPLAAVYMAQVLALAASAALAGVVIGGALSLAGAALAAERLPVAPASPDLTGPLGVAWLFGILTATTFALPAVGRALSIAPAALFRGIDAAATATPRRWWAWTGVAALATTALLVLAMPQPLFGAGFVAVIVLLLLALEGIVRAIRVLAGRFGHHPALDGHFALKLAISNLHRPGSPLRVTLLSLGSALTVLVASAIVVAALLRTIDESIPEQAPALVLYDVASDQVGTLRDIASETTTLERLDLVPLVLGRMSHVDGQGLRESTDGRRVLESSDEHKLTHRLGNIDAVTVVRGHWWPEDYAGPPLVAFEDREADQIGLEVGDRLRFRIMDRTLDAELAAIYSQRGVGTRFWFEGMFSDGALDPFVTRHVGAAYLDDVEAIELEARIARSMPNVVQVRTERILAEARAMLGRAAGGLALIAAVTLSASLLVLASVMATSRARQVYDATVLHTLGARLATIRASLSLEYALIALLTSAFAVGLGGAIALAVLRLRIRLEPASAWQIGAAVALVVSALSLGLGALVLMRRLRIAPATLLRTSG